MRTVTYKSAGVNRDIGERAKDSIKEIAQISFSENVLKGLGLFSGFYSLDVSNYKEPVLVSSIDGVGTKVIVAQMMARYQSIGIDLVNHCVNDIMVCGADPIFFMDYIAADHLTVGCVEEIVRGIAWACREANCALISGETAEMPGVYTKNSFDLAGAIVGVVEKNSIIDGDSIRPDDLLIGIASNGLHTNGYSLAREIFFEHKKYPCSQYLEDTQMTLGEALLLPHLSYRELIEKVRRMEGVHGMAHITGGGIEGNITRLLGDQLSVRIDWSAWEILPIFELIMREGQVPESEMRRVFNLGIGLVLIVHPDWATEIIKICQAHEGKGYVIGSVIQN